MANRRRPRSRLHAVMRCGLLALLVLFVYWDNTALRTDSLTYTSTALPTEFDGLRIVQLSDLHNREFGKNNQRLYAAVKQAAPDLIFLTGDLVDEYAEAPIPYAKAVGKALSAIAPTYYVTGNHEWAHGNAAVEELKTVLRESGVTVLSNQFVTLERGGDSVVLAGIDDFSLENTERIVHGWIEQKGYSLGQVMNTLRLALVGAGKGPGMYDVTSFIGKEETLRRIDNLLRNLKPGE